jgi:hypothetical protein
LQITKGEPRKVPYAGRIGVFADCCGTHLFFGNKADPPTVDVTVASLDASAPFAPEKAIWLEDEPPWVRLNEALPSYTRSSQSQ